MRYWKRVDGQGKATTVEGYSHDLVVAGAVEIAQAEFAAFIAALPPPPLTPEQKEWASVWTSTSQKLAMIGKRLGLE